MDEMKRFYYTFGGDLKFPYQCGWVVVVARNWEEAHAKFRNRFPDRHENTLNCAFCYDADQWAKMNPEKAWTGWKCFEIIA